MLVVIENGRLMQMPSTTYLSTLGVYSDDPRRRDAIHVPLSFHLLRRGSRVPKLNYHGPGRVFNRDGGRFVALGAGYSFDPEEYEIGEVTQEADDYYTGALWGVYNAHRRALTAKRQSTRYLLEPQRALPHTDAAHQGVKYGGQEYNALFKPKRKRAAPKANPAGRLPPITPGNLGGPGYTEKSDRARHAILRESVAEEGYRSTLGKILLLERYGKRTMHRDTLRLLARDRAWLRETFGGPGSFAT